MNEVLNFQFYSILKNEDAPPFIGNDFIVAADGLGGSGSNLHKIDYDKFPDLADIIFEAAYGDFDDDTRKDIEDYLRTLVSQIADGEAHTSALWASRIVIGRFIYAMIKKDIDGNELDLSNEETREKLSRFISKGLHSVADKLSLDSGIYDSQILLPTTLAAIKFTEKENSVHADCIWAGDSRCYALLPSGLKILSIDDEDASGSVTNLFYCSGKDTILHYKHYELEKPCVLMTVSDGVFDPFDPEDYLGVEYTFEKAIAESENAQELSDNLRQTYDNIRADDTTVAFCAFGYDSYFEMKQSMAKRSEYTASLVEKKRKLSEKAAVASISEDEAFSYIVTRTSDKYPSIANALIKVILDGSEDIAISEKLKEMISQSKKAFTETLQKAHQSARQNAITKLIDKAYEELRDHPEKLNECFDRAAIGSNTTLNGFFGNLLNVADEYLKASSFASKNKEKTDRLELEYKDLRNKISERSEFYYNIIRKMLTRNISVEYNERWNATIRMQVFWNEVERAFVNNVCIYSYRDFVSSNKTLKVLRLENLQPSKADAALIKQISKYFSFKKASSDFSNDNAPQQSMVIKKYESALLATLDRLRAEADPSFFFSEKFKAAFLDMPSASFGEEPVDEKAFVKILEDFFETQKDVIAQLIVDALATAHDQTSVIDVMYNASKLYRFRLYNRVKGEPMTDVEEFQAELKEMENEFNSLAENGAE